MATTVEVLVVAGGGGGGNVGGGGGAGGYQYDGSHSLAPGSYSVTVGTGGAGGAGSSSGGAGNNSVFDTITANGGGFGATTVALPTTTVISTKLNILFKWSTADSAWLCVATA